MSKELLYEDITDIAALKNAMLNYLIDYNNYPGVVPMDLVLFRDAIEHGEHQHRVIVASWGETMNHAP
jgi:dynein heavy chain